MPIHADNFGWIIETAATAYALGINSSGALTHRYWGVRLPVVTDYPPPLDAPQWSSFDMPPSLTPEEFPGYSSFKFSEPACKVTFADGVRDLRWRFARAEILTTPESETLAVHLSDEYYPLSVTLHYRIRAGQDVLERWVTLRNTGPTPIQAERIFSAVWHLPVGDFRLTHLTGRWFDEFHIRREALNYGVKVLDSRRLTTSHHHNPWFALDRGTADEDQGEVWFGALAWSGNWKITAEVTDSGATQVGIGLNDWDFVWSLAPASEFTSPIAVAGYTTQGFGGASRLLHRFVRDSIVPHRQVVHKVLYNSWEATAFDVNESGQIALAEIAAEMGVELFVMDDGWFKGRNHDHAGLGDWTPDPAKFPHGLMPLIDRVNALGMDFGLWLEPEMVNQDSDLYRAHPDWVIHFPTRPRSEARNQLILNLARLEVQDHLIAVLDNLLAAHPITFIKWDINRIVSEPGWPDAAGDQRELWVRYVQGLYRVLGELRARHPQIIWQSCSGGGGRADLGMLRFADQIWVSDNTNAGKRLEIQEGYSLVFPASTMEAWVTDMGAEQFPLKFRFHVSMCGSLGLGANLLRWDESDRAEAKRLIDQYKAIRHIVHEGEQYRLLAPHRGPFSAVQYQSATGDSGVVFAFRTFAAEPSRFPRLYLRGLDPHAQYQVEGEAQSYSGQALMTVGLAFALGNFESVMRRITRQ